jgi:predicted patatin/cPLA2 family phospholipase
LAPDTHGELSCITAIRMSSNLPLIFEKFKYGNSYYVDGGISENFAILEGEKRGEKVLGINIESIVDNYNTTSDNIIEYIYALMFIPVNQSINYKISQVTDKSKIVSLSYSKLKFCDFNISTSDKLDMFSKGYSQMKTVYE